MFIGVAPPPTWQEVRVERYSFDLRQGPSLQGLNSDMGVPFTVTAFEPWAGQNAPGGILRVCCPLQPESVTEAYRRFFQNRLEFYDESYNNFVLYSVEGGRGVVNCLRYTPVGDYVAHEGKCAEKAVN